MRSLLIGWRKIEGGEGAHLPFFLSVRVGKDGGHPGCIEDMLMERGRMIKRVDQKGGRRAGNAELSVHLVGESIWEVEGCVSWGRLCCAAQV